MNSPTDLWKLMRPHQWIKNAFVFTGFFFSQNMWRDYHMFLYVTMTAIAFSFLSSAAYIFNDIFDIESDKKHPKKKARPLAAGKVSVFAAYALSILLALSSLLLSVAVSYHVLVILLLYALMNILYSYYLKRVVILDVFCIAAGFMLRIIAGTIGVGIAPSRWLLLCGLTITLFLGFAKRRAEILTLKTNKEEFREVLGMYDPIVLDEFIAICAAGVIITYSLYTMSTETIAIHHTENLIYTVPFVIYGLFRYIFLLHHFKKGGEPSKDLVRDPHVIGSVMGWLILTILIFVM